MAVMTPALAPPPGPRHHNFRCAVAGVRRAGAPAAETTGDLVSRARPSAEPVAVAAAVAGGAVAA